MYGQRVSLDPSNMVSTNTRLRVRLPSNIIGQHGGRCGAKSSKQPGVWYPGDFSSFPVALPDQPAGGASPLMLQLPCTHDDGLNSAMPHHKHLSPHTASLFAEHSCRVETYKRVCIAVVETWMFGQPASR